MKTISFEPPDILSQLVNLHKEGKFIVGIRNHKIYAALSSDRECMTFVGMFGSEDDLIEYQKDDRIYVFNEEEQISKTLQSGACLDKFLFKPAIITNEDIKSDIVTRLAKGEFIGAIVKSTGKNSRRKRLVLRHSTNDKEINMIGFDDDKPGLMVIKNYYYYQNDYVYY